MPLFITVVLGVSNSTIIPPSEDGGIRRLEVLGYRVVHRNGTAVLSTDMPVSERHEECVLPVIEPYRIAMP